MSFPTTVRNDALISCGRHCCICHKFCGTKIELHHIKTQRDGGDNSFDNCIPLCFDCHADVESYNSNHPKGNKYTEPELKKHRSSWYLKVEGNPGVVPLPEHLELDRAVFRKIKELLPWDGPILFVHQHHFGISFEMDKIYVFNRFVSACENPSFEFIDADLEGARANLLASIIPFIGTISLQTWPTNLPRTNAMPKENAVPKEWQHEQPARYKEVTEQLNQSGSKIVESYDLLIKLGRKKLGTE